MSAKRCHLLVSTGLMGLICADVLRPDMSWFISPATPKNLTVHLARTRDPQGWALLHPRCDADRRAWPPKQRRSAASRSSKRPRAERWPRSPSATASSCCRRCTASGAARPPAATSISCCTLSGSSSLRSGDGARVQHHRAAQHRGPHRPLPHRLPTRPESVRGLPPRACIHNGLCDAAAVGGHAGQAVLGPSYTPCWFSRFCLAQGWSARG